MESLPDEIWLKIFEIGISNSTLLLKDLFSLSMSSKHFYHLSNDNIPWSALLTLNYPKYAAKYSSSISSCSSVRSLYEYTLRLSISEWFGKICKLFVNIMDRDPVLYYQNLKIFGEEIGAAFPDLEYYLRNISNLWTCDPIDGSLTPGQILVNFSKKKDQILHTQQDNIAAQQNLQVKIDILIGHPLEYDGDDDEDGGNGEP